MVDYFSTLFTDNIQYLLTILNYNDKQIALIDIFKQCDFLEIEDLQKILNVIANNLK